MNNNQVLVSKNNYLIIGIYFSHDFTINLQQTLIWYLICSNTVLHLSVSSWIWDPCSSLLVPCYKKGCHWPLLAYLGTFECNLEIFIFIFYLFICKYYERYQVSSTIIYFSLYDPIDAVFPSPSNAK